MATIGQTAGIVGLLSRCPPPVVDIANRTWAQAAGVRLDSVRRSLRRGASSGPAVAANVAGDRPSATTTMPTAGQRASRRKFDRHRRRCPTRATSSTPMRLAVAHKLVAGSRRLPSLRRRLAAAARRHSRRWRLRLAHHAAQHPALAVEEQVASAAASAANAEHPLGSATIVPSQVQLDLHVIQYAAARGVQKHGSGTIASASSVRPGRDRPGRKSRRQRVRRSGNRARSPSRRS